MSSVTMAQAIRDALADELQRDENIVVIGENVGRGGGIAGTCAGLLAEFGPQRVLETPVADRAALGLAVGMALAGKRPVVELTSTSRLPAALEVLAEAASVAQGEFQLPLVIRVPFGGEAGGRVDRPIADLLGGIEGVAVCSPSTPDLAPALIRAALRATQPVVVLEPRSAYGDRTRVTDLHVNLGEARSLRDGGHVTLVSWGTGVAAALHAADRLATEGIEACVVDLVTLRPIDAATLGSWVRETGRLVLVHPEEGSVGTDVLAAALGEAFLYYEAPPATAPAHPDRVVQAARDAVYY